MYPGDLRAGPYDDLTMFLAAGVTTIRNMWGVPQYLTWRSQIARGERLGPTIVTAGPLLDGDPLDWPGSIFLSRPADADKLVTEIQAAALAPPRRSPGPSQSRSRRSGCSAAAVALA